MTTLIIYKIFSSKLFQNFSS